MALRSNLRRVRVELGLSQNDLAKQLGTDQGYISQLETCVRNPSRRLGKRIAEVLMGDPAMDGFLFDEGVIEEASAEAS